MGNKDDRDARTDGSMDDTDNRGDRDARTDDSTGNKKRKHQAGHSSLMT